MLISHIGGWWHYLCPQGFIISVKAETRRLARREYHKRLKDSG